MRKRGSVVARWVGGLFLLMVPYVLVCGYFYPRGDQFLNRFTCDAGQHLDDHGADPNDVPGRTTTSSLEITCKDPVGIYVNATGRLFEVAALFLALSLGFFVASHRLAQPRFAPSSRPGP